MHLSIVNPRDASRALGRDLNFIGRVSEAVFSYVCDSIFPPGKSNTIEHTLQYLYMVQCEAVHAQATTAHILGGCPAALTQGCFTYCHNQIVICLATEVLMMFPDLYVIMLTYLDRMQVTTPCTFAVSLLIAPYNLVICRRSNLWL